MIVAELEGIVFIAVIASTSLLCGLLRTAADSKGSIASDRGAACCRYSPCR
jgi:hypothetical protein